MSFSHLRTQYSPQQQTSVMRIQIWCWVCCGVCTAVVAVDSSDVFCFCGNLIIGGGAYSWPLVSTIRMMLYSSTHSMCSVTTALNDYIYWTQTSSDADAIADRYRSVSKIEFRFQETNRTTTATIWLLQASQVRQCYRTLSTRLPASNVRESLWALSVAVFRTV